MRWHLCRDVAKSQTGVEGLLHRVAVHSLALRGGRLLPASHQVTLEGAVLFLTNKTRQAKE